MKKAQKKLLNYKKTAEFCQLRVTASSGDAMKNFALKVLVLNIHHFKNETIFLIFQFVINLKLNFGIVVLQGTATTTLDASYCVLNCFSQD